MGSSGFTSRNKSHISTGGGRELQGGKDEGLEKWEKLRYRDVCSQEGRETENEEREESQGWEITKVEVIYSHPCHTLGTFEVQYSDSKRTGVCAHILNY